MMGVCENSLARSQGMRSGASACRRGCALCGATTRAVTVARSAAIGAPDIGAKAPIYGLPRQLIKRRRAAREGTAGRPYADARKHSSIG